MSKLYGSLTGDRQTVTRRGSQNSGIQASLQSWNSSLIVYMNVDGQGIPSVTLKTAQGSTSYGDKLIFSGTLQELEEKLKG